MPILEMQKIRLLAHKDSIEGVIDVIQRHGVMEIKESEDAKDAKSVYINNNFRESLPRIENTVEFLKEYEENKKSIFSKNPVLTENYCKEVLYEFDYANILERVNVLREKIRTEKQKIRDIESRSEDLSFWEDLPFAVSPDNLRTEHTETTFFVPASDKNDGRDWQLAIEKENFAASVFPSKNGGIVVTHFIEDRDAVLGFFKKEGFDEANTSFFSHGEEVDEGQTPADMIKQLSRAKKDHEAELSKLKKKAHKFSSKYLSVFLVLKDLMTWEKDKENALGSAKGTDVALTLEGWCPKNKLGVLIKDIENETNIFEIKKIKPKKGEVPPVEIENSGMFKSLESVTRLYGLPGYRDLDPTAHLAIFFVISFGLALTDLGYGIFLMLASFAALKIFKLAGLAKLYANTLFAGGAAAAFFGLLTGGFLGIDSSSLPVFMQKMQKFDIIGDPLSVFYLSLAIGVVQVFFGMILRILRERKNGNLAEGLMTQAPWLFTFISVVLYGASSMGYIPGPTEWFLWAVYASGVSIVLSGLMLGKTIPQRIGKSFGGLYSGIGYFSDILSYSRLFALGLATTALAFSVNMIAMIVIDTVPVVGYVLAAFVLVAGHAFNVVVNTLGAFIHSARLQFVEFFGKFIEETGRPFKPLERKSTFVVLEDK